MILDSRSPLEYLRQVGRMCELAGVDAVWSESLPILRAVAEVTRRLTLGFIQTGAPLARSAGEGWEHAEDDLPFDRTELTVWASAGPAPERGRHKLGFRLSEGSQHECELAARYADDAVLSAARRQLPAIEPLRGACRAIGREPSSLGIAWEVPVSIGRTYAEASARAVAARLFNDDHVGQPMEVGLFGTLEECQRGVLDLAYAGVTDLRCWLPDASDLPDVIAQLTAMVTGRVDALSPTAPRSKDPDPPAGWGGRSRFTRTS